MKNLHTQCHSCGAIETNTQPLFPVPETGDHGLFCDICYDQATQDYHDYEIEMMHEFINAPCEW